MEDEALVESCTDLHIDRRITRDGLGSGSAFGSGQRLPDDVLRTICIEAAQQDRCTAQALALTSHKVCRWTAKARWSTIVLTSVPQLVALWGILYAVPDAVVSVFVDLFHGVHDNSPMLEAYRQGWIRARDAMEARTYRTVAPSGKLLLSIPKGQPHTYIQDLFIDVFDQEEAPDDGIRDPQTKLRTACVALHHNIVSYGYALPDPINILQRWSGSGDTALKRVSLGGFETESIYWHLLEDVAVSELSIVMHGEERADRSILIPRSVQRLHIVGHSPASPLSGVSPPWKMFRQLMTPFMERNLSGRRTASLRRLTHLRYDTRRFSLKPAEITANRMRPIFQELTLARPDQYGSSSSHEDPSITAAFRFDGPPHAAPARGAGSYDALLRHSRLQPIHLLAKQGDPVACYMLELGIGQLMYFQLAWEPMGRGSALDSSKPTRDQTGGWPRERRGAWTERSEKSDAFDAFAVELRDAINVLYGWHANNVEAAGRYCRHRERMADQVDGDPWERNCAFSPDSSGMAIAGVRNGITETDRLEMRTLIDLIKINVPEWHQTHPALALDDTDTVQIGIRAPRSLLHLGGKAAFNKEDRLGYFEDRACGGPGPWP